METLETIGNIALGNTKTKATRIIPSKYWCFTLNNYKDEELETLETIFREAGEFIYGKEVGESGTRHLQGYIEFFVKVRPSERIKDKRIHWEKRKGSKIQAVEYCKKDGNYITNIIAERKLDVLDESELYDWQKNIVKIIKEIPDKRTINWFWESKGNSGKTTFSKYLSHNYGAIPVEGKKNDILYCAAQFKSDIYIFDFERSMEEFISYGGIEKIKNGYYMCSKYESKPIIRNCPHIIIFANFEPDLTKLSKDRWNVVNIREGEGIDSM